MTAIVYTPLDDSIYYAIINALNDKDLLGEEYSKKTIKKNVSPVSIDIQNVYNDAVETLKNKINNSKINNSNLIGAVCKLFKIGVRIEDLDKNKSYTYGNDTYSENIELYRVIDNYYITKLA